VTAARREQTLFQAIGDLTDGLTGLVRNHLQLVRHEVRADATELTHDVAAILLAASVLAIGYCLLLTGAIFMAGWWAGLVGMGVCALTLSFIHLIAGAIALRAVTSQFRRRHYGLALSGEELERSKEWMKQLPAPEP
jgi:hypothetical protein